MPLRRINEITLSHLIYSVDFLSFTTAMMKSKAKIVDTNKYLKQMFQLI